MAMTRNFPPRLMPAPQAAYYIGVSESKLRSLGLRRRRQGGKLGYDRADLDDYVDSLPYEDEDAENTCDALWGMTG